MRRTDSSENEKLGHSHVELTIKNGAIEKVVHTSIDKEGKQKDEHYGEGKEPGAQKKAQNAYKAIVSYGEQLTASRISQRWMLSQARPSAMTSSRKRSRRR